LIWESIVDHRPYAGYIGLVIPEDWTPDVTHDSPFSESRRGIGRLRVKFNADLDPRSVTSASVALAGRGLDGALNLHGILIEAEATQDDELEITFSPTLPDFAKYRVELQGLLTSSGTPVTQGLSRIFTALRGDATDDGRVNATDVGGVRGLVHERVGPAPAYDPIAIRTARSDVFTDGRINATDVAVVRYLVGRDARTIQDP
jgi:hypothetical protein